MNFFSKSKTDSIDLKSNTQSGTHSRTNDSFEPVIFNESNTYSATSELITSKTQLTGLFLVSQTHTAQQHAYFQ